MKVVREIILICGFGLYMYGVWNIYPPAACISGGIAMMWFAHPPTKKKPGK